ncbi:hypothetical protein QFZ60_001607 [Arthrobacter sp. B2I5]|uniref:hypothetical protein n=1 Tax=Arthrobacter sp. B2I5 TaxID=3042266 RepID=UPI00277FD863|nr:hypothetical protein [Arthrobacter sp. B2I5]MDQ0825434.1 hypothetical protein [Arthrobacter sp. B2I5]
MTYRQLISPNPNVSCKPGWCLMYVQDTFGIAPVYPTATAAWNASTTKHWDYNFPPGCWVAVWFSLRDEPAGHVALLAPDGSVYSSSHPTKTTPVHHASLDALIQYYAKANPLTYLGWTEDVEGVAVISKGDDMAKITKEQENSLSILAVGEYPGKDYDYRWTGKELTQDSLDQMLQNWLNYSKGNGLMLRLGQQDQQIADLKKQLAEAKTAVTVTAASDSDKKLQAIRDALGIE